MRFINFFMAFCVHFIAVIGFCEGSLQFGNEPFCCNFELTNGWRQDKLSARVNSYDPKLLSIDTLKAKNINYYQVGLKADASLCHWYGRVETDWAWSDSGNYREQVKTPDCRYSLSKASLHRGRAKDFSGAAGYLFPLGRCFSAAPLVGWSYDSQVIRLGHGRTDGQRDKVLDSLQYFNRWQGPWAGADCQWNWENLTLKGGYEYHWAHWHAKWKLHGSDVANGAFSDRRKSDHAHGQVIYADGRWNFCSGWYVGVGGKYQWWRAEEGHLKPLTGNFASVGLRNSEVDKVKCATWKSVSATVDIGFTW